MELCSLHPAMIETSISRVLNGNKEAYRDIISKYKDSCFTLAISILKDEHAAMDAVQSTFINSYLKLDKFNHKSTFKTWLHRILVNECFHILRKIKHLHTGLNEDIHPVHTTENQTKDQFESDHLTFYIQQILQQLKPKESLVLKLFYLEEYSLKEIQEITGWSMPGIKVTLHRARTNMKQILCENYQLSPKDLYI